jgi:hypothetical protein
MPLLGSGHGIARKKSSASKARMNDHSKFGGDIPDFENIARKGSTPNMVGLAFTGGAESDDRNRNSNSNSVPVTQRKVVAAEELSPRTSLTKKKKSLWD